MGKGRSCPGKVAKMRKGETIFDKTRFGGRHGGAEPPPKIHVRAPLPIMKEGEAPSSQKVFALFPGRDSRRRIVGGSEETASPSSEVLPCAQKGEH